MSSVILNSFSRFSYFEAFSGSHFVSLYPSVDTKKYTKKTVGFRVFDTPNFTEDDLKVYLKFLVSQNFGFKDMIGWLFPSSESSKLEFKASDICNHLNFLEITYVDNDSDNFASLVSVASPVFTTTHILRFTENSLPQKAIDTIPCYVGDTGITTTVGYKKKSKYVNVIFSDGEVIQVLQIGIFGYVNGAGEHVNARQEGAKINECIAEHRENINNPDKIAFYKDVEIANRGLIEEVGLDIAHDARTKFYIFGISDRVGRDVRYVGHQYTADDIKLYEFGYTRSSESILVASITKGNPPEVLPDPSDVEEMEIGKSRLIKLEELLLEFNASGKYIPAFPEHTNQLILLSQKLHLMM